MRYTVFILAISLFLISCGQSDTKQKELELKERELVLREKELLLKNKDTIIAKIDTPKSNQVQAAKQTDLNTKVMIMVFEEYSEGDYPHLIFKETSSGKSYDFRHISDNQLGNVKVLLDDDNASFGLKANPKYLKKSFIVEAVNKTVPDYDLNGKTIKIKDWVIKSIKPSDVVTDLERSLNTGKANKQTTAKFLSKNNKLILLINRKEFILEKDFNTAELVQEHEPGKLTVAGIYESTYQKTYSATLRNNGDIIVEETLFNRIQGQLKAESRVILKVKSGEY